MQEIINEFFDSHNYDVRVSQNARWIDQKCTCDVLSIIADCILEHTNYDVNVEFSIKDIWESKYAKQNVVSIFSKPHTDSQLAKNEYDKFFSQPINLFAYSRILEFLGKRRTNNIFKINNLEILEFIATRDTNALKFLILYIKKVLQDSDLLYLFDDFLQCQDKDTFKNLKDAFIEFTISNTPINQSIECGRIFTKILNPLAFNSHKKGTIRGCLSKTSITLDELKYNRINWRDKLSGKDKHNQGLSEVKQANEVVLATQIHHIFPAADFPSISDYIENLIALTPNQHFSYAHPDNQTSYINKDFQYVCLLAKASTIMNDLTQTYDFNAFKFVLNTGLNTDEFQMICDFSSLITKLDCFYSDFSGHF